MSRWFLRAALVALLAVAFHTACERSTISSDQGGATVIDTEVMAFLSAARARHHEANVLEQSGNVDGAIGALEKVTTMAKPHADVRIPEVEEVLADTHARLADLRVGKGDIAGATRDVQAGLDHAKDPGYFRGHLLEEWGIVEETHAKQLADAGKKDEAEKTRQHALDLLRQAVDMQEKVIGHAIPEAGSR